MSDKVEVTQRTRLRRMRERGHFDRGTIHAILDAMPLCHIGYVQDGAPVVMPTMQWRENDHVYWHASNGGRGVKAWRESPVCLTVSLLDGLVLARSGLHHSANYRSVMVFGQPSMIADEAQKRERLDGLIDALYPGRSKELRPHTDSEIRQTAVFSLPIEEASAKIRTGGPVDDEKDHALPIWAGTVPIRLNTQEPEPDPGNPASVDVPHYVSELSLGS